MSVREKANGRLARIRSANGSKTERKPDEMRGIITRLSLTPDGAAFLSWLEENYLFRPAPPECSASALSEKEGQRRLVHQILNMVGDVTDDSARRDSN